MEKIFNFIKKNIKWFIFLIMMILFLEIVESLFKDELFSFDNSIYDFIFSFSTPFLTSFFKAITFLGDALFIGGVSIYTLLFFHKKGIMLCCNLFIILLFNIVLKHLFLRPRPIINQLIPIAGYSFPSGHSMVSMAFYGYLFYLSYRYVNNKMLRYLFCIILSILIVLIGISRIYLGVHYPSDVLSGFCFSIAYLVVFIHFTKSFEQ